MAGEDQDYIVWLAMTQPCVGCGARSGPPHHPRHDVGAGRRAHDRRAVPMCYLCHDSIHRLTYGRFKGWTRQQVRDFLDDHGMRLSALYSRTHDGE
jgi:hypothetical protein